MTLTIVNHCHALNSPNGKTFIVVGKLNGSKDVLEDRHAYRLKHHDYLPPYFSSESEGHKQDAPDGSRGILPSTRCADGSEAYPIPSFESSSKRGPSGFFGKDLVMDE